MRRYFWVLSSLSLSLTILMVAIALASVLRSHITGLAASMLNVAYSLSGNLPGVFGRQKAALAFYSSSSSGLSTAATTAFAPTSLSTASRISQAQVSSSGAERSSKSISTMTTPEQNGAMPEPPLDSTQAAKQPELPKLSAEQFRVYNRLAVMMNQYVSISILSLLQFGAAVVGSPLKPTTSNRSSCCLPDLAFSASRILYLHC